MYGQSYGPEIPHEIEKYTVVHMENFGENRVHSLKSKYELDKRIESSIATLH